MFLVRQVHESAALSTEQMGTKFKFWFQDSDFGLCLFKEGRPGTGENWAEKVACELATLLGIPRAAYELAQCGTRQGVISPSLVARGARLVHGNELLGTFEAEYGEHHAKTYRQTGHTLRRVLGYLRASGPQVGAPVGFIQTPEISSAQDVFVGYLMLDAFIANQDRHDQNWALLRTTDGNSFLAPTFDHGSSMARNETDQRRETILTTRDAQQQMPAYAARARSALFPHAPESSGRVRALHTFDAFTQAARHTPNAGKAWLRRLEGVTEEQIHNVLRQIPNAFISETARRFTAALLCHNRSRLVEGTL